MSDQQLQRKKIRMKIKTSIDTRFIFAANPKLTILQVSEQIGKACEEFLPSHSKVKKVKALKKDDYYLRETETVGDLIDDLDQIYCQVQLFGKKKENNVENKSVKEKKHQKQEDKSSQNKKQNKHKDTKSSQNAEDQQKSTKVKKQKHESKNKQGHKSQFKTPKSGFNPDDIIKKLQEAEAHVQKTSSRKNSVQKSSKQQHTKQDKPKPKVIVKSEDSQSD